MLDDQVKTVFTKGQWQRTLSQSGHKDRDQIDY